MTFVTKRQQKGTHGSHVSHPKKKEEVVDKIKKRKERKGKKKEKGDMWHVRGRVGRWEEVSPLGTNRCEKRKGERNGGALDDVSLDF